MGRDISVGIATRYGLDDPGIGSSWGQGFPYPSWPVMEPTRPPTQWVPAVLPVEKAAGAWRWPHPPLFSAQIKERGELYLYLI